MSKPELRNRLAALSFCEKARMLEKLPGRSRAVAASRLRVGSPGSDTPTLDDQSRLGITAGRGTEE